MNKVIDFPVHRRPVGETATTQGPAAVIFFPGVRYERRHEADGAGTRSAKPDEGRVPDRLTN